MIGYAVHALVMEPELGSIVGALGSVESVPSVGVYDISKVRAWVRPLEEAL